MQCMPPVLEKDKCSSSEKKRPPSVVVKWDGGLRELCRCFENRPGKLMPTRCPYSAGHVPCAEFPRLVRKRELVARSWDS